MKRVVTLLSGGLDSTTLLYYLKSRGYDVRGLGVNYGQRHKKELDAARIITAKENIPYDVVDLSPVSKLLSSSLTTPEISVPDGHYAEETMKITVVPNRNAILLSIAAGFAASLSAESVGMAAHAGDHFIYPDCRPEFFDAYNEMLQYALEDMWNVEIITPFVELTKAEIVAIGHDLEVPYELTWSCYKGGQIHCGTCGTCVERKEAFELAGVKDPTEYLK